MKKALIILSLSLGWCLPAHARDVSEFKGCVKNGSSYTCSYNNPHATNPSVQMLCARVVQRNDTEEMAKPRYYKYCNPTYEFPIEGKNMADAVTKAKEKLRTLP